MVLLILIVLLLICVCYLVYVIVLVTPHCSGINHVVMGCCQLLLLLSVFFLFRFHHQVFTVTHTVSSELRQITKCIMYTVQTMSNYVFKGGAIGAVGVRIGKNPWTANYSMNQPNASDCITA